MNSTYFLIPVILLSVILYSVSYIFYKSDIITKTIHSKIWNTILLITFLITAVLGILLAIQINYKLEWSFVKTLLKWHVNFGIGMSFVAIIHLYRHFNYYLNLFNAEPGHKITNTRKEITPVLNFRKFNLLVFLSGFIATVIQVIFLREVTTIFQGNELMIAWTLGIWMTLTGTGAYVGKNLSDDKHFYNRVSRILVLLALLPPICVISLILIKGLLFPVGILIHPLWFLMIIFLVFTPVGVLSGWLFSVFIAIYRKQVNGFISVYSYETFGSMLGGGAVAFIFIFWITSLESLLILSAGILLFMSFYNQKKSYLVGTSLILFVLLALLIFPFENRLKTLIFNHQNVLKSIDTKHGNITITENAGQSNVFENGSLSYTSDNTILNEEAVHYAMLQRSKPEHILIAGGDITGMLKELKKYKSVKQIDFIEPNPKMTDIVSAFFPLKVDNQLRIIPIDPRKYIKETTKEYDIAIMNLPDPTSLQINRLYTIEFMEILKKRISANGIVQYSISPAGNYLSVEKKDMEASVYNNLRKYFNYVEIIPGEKDYFLASDSSLSASIGVLSKGWEEINTYVNPYYMDDGQINQRSKFIKNAIESNPSINSDTHPYVVFANTLHYISMFRGAGILLIFILIIMLLLPLLFVTSAGRGMYIAGITASSVEIILLFIFQSVFGTIYSSIGLLIAVFMAGLTIGALIIKRISDIRSLLSITCLLLTICVATIPLLYKIMTIASSISTILFILFYIFIIASLIGSLFYLYSASKQHDSANLSSIVYAADLIGSAFGVIIATVFLIPVLGIPATCYIIAGLNIIPAIIHFRKQKF